jgi:hypothetical protein
LREVSGDGAELPGGGDTSFPGIWCTSWAKDESNCDDSDDAEFDGEIGDGYSRYCEESRMVDCCVGIRIPDSGKDLGEG